jgi:hypothetical protein
MDQSCELLKGSSMLCLCREKEVARGGGEGVYISSGNQHVAEC